MSGGLDASVLNHSVWRVAYRASVGLCGGEAAGRGQGDVVHGLQHVAVRGAEPVVEVALHTLQVRRGESESTEFTSAFIQDSYVSIQSVPT
jgi:hypothetical protein